MNVMRLKIFLVLITILSSSNTNAQGYDDLVELFYSWRDFVKPQLINDVPDYSKESLTTQYASLAEWKEELHSIDTSSWTTSHKIDWMLVWAEMNGFDFDHRVVKPWERDPAFYIWFYPNPTDVPEREGPNIYGSIEIPEYGNPLSKEEAKEISKRLSVMHPLYEQAKINLTGNAKDLWILGAKAVRGQSDDLRNYAERTSFKDLKKALLEAADASDAFASWLESQSGSKTGLSGIGKDNYTWNLQNVHLLPYSWEEEEVLLKRELARAHTALRMEENRNKALTPLLKIDNEEEYTTRFQEAIEEYLIFLSEQEIILVQEYMAQALLDRLNGFRPSTDLRGFFGEIHYREPLIMRTHDYHWLDLARMREEPNSSPIRQIPLMYNIFDGRAEGMATGMEEMMMHAGLLDNKPRARELIWILLAQRAARGLAGLYQHGLEMTFEEATVFASKWTPWGLLPAEGSTIQGEEHFYLQQPAYGTSYVIGKIEIEKLIAEYARQKEDKFALLEFMDEFNKAGLIPVSMIHWELTDENPMLHVK